MRTAKPVIPIKIAPLERIGISPSAVVIAIQLETALQDQRRLPRQRRRPLRLAEVYSTLAMDFPAVKVTLAAKAVHVALQRWLRTVIAQWVT